MNLKTLLLVNLYYLTFSLAGFSTNTDSLKLVNKLNKKFLKKSAYLLIPSGSISTYQLIYSTDYARILTTKEVPRIKEKEISSFMMKKGEVTNSDYLKLLYYYKTKDLEKYKTLLPDTLVWRTPLAYNEPYVEYYMRHPAYQEYPIVGVSHHQAELYCEWLTEVYHQNPDRIYQKVIYRLPTEAEWIYAANGGLSNANYPWAGPYMRNAAGKIKANCLNFGTEGVYRDTLYKKDRNGNFKEVYIYRAQPHHGIDHETDLNDYSDITAPTISYWPNNYGLYNMAGNVCEMVAEKGITHGGSWNDPGHYLQNHIRQFYEGEHSSSHKRGFRVVMQILEY